MLDKCKSLSQLLVCSYVIRLLITGASLGDALALASLAGVYGYFLYLESKREPEINKEIKEKVILLEKLTEQTNNRLSAMQLRR